MPKSRSDDVHRYLHGPVRRRHGRRPDGRRAPGARLPPGAARRPSWRSPPWSRGMGRWCSASAATSCATRMTRRMLSRPRFSSWPARRSVRRRDTLGPYFTASPSAWRPAPRHERAAATARTPTRRAGALRVRGAGGGRYRRVVHEELGRLPDSVPGRRRALRSGGKDVRRGGAAPGLPDRHGHEPPVGSAAAAAAQAWRGGLAPAGGAIATVFAEEAGATTTARCRGTGRGDGPGRELGGQA